MNSYSISQKYEDRHMSWAIYCGPKAVVTGLSERQARELLEALQTPEGDE